MANWQRTVNLQPEWDRCKDGEITPAELARVLADRLRGLKPFGGDDSDLDDRREELADWFDEIARHDNNDVEEFDTAMAELYDWGDTRLDSDDWTGTKCCWIDTTGTRAAVA